MFVRAWRFESSRPHDDDELSGISGNVVLVTHSREIVARALALDDEGRTTTQISALLAVPRRTVADWLAGRTPSRYPSDMATWTVPERAEQDYVHLLGLYLGDGCLSAHPRDVYKLRIVLDAVYPRIINECTASMRAVIGTSVRCWPRPSNDVEVYAYSKDWPQVFPQHGAGMKHLRRIALLDWQNALVRRHSRPTVARAHPVGRLPVHEHRTQLALAPVLVQQPVGRHPRDLLRRLRPARRAVDHRAAHGVRLPPGRRRATGRIHRSEGLNEAPLCVPDHCHSWDLGAYARFRCPSRAETVSVARQPASVPMSLDIEFPCDRRAPARARDAFREMGGQLDPQLAADVELLVSELVSNSVKYGGDGAVRLSALSDRPRHVWVEVADEGQGFVAVPRDRAPTEAGGWGLQLVDSMADRWGVHRASTRVWFEIDR